MLILIDSNIIIDGIVNRLPFAENARKIFELCADSKISGCIAGHTIPDVYYVLENHYKVEERRELLFGICKMLDVVGIEKTHILNALKNESFKDFEDCLQSECAKLVNADYIVSRNINDFKQSSIQAILPEDFLRLTVDL